MRGACDAGCVDCAVAGGVDAVHDAYCGGVQPHRCPWTEHRRRDSRRRLCHRNRIEAEAGDRLDWAWAVAVAVSWRRRSTFSAVSWGCWAPR